MGMLASMRQKMGLPMAGAAPAYGQAPKGFATDDYGNPEAGSAGVAPHIAARAGYGAAGGGSQGSLESALKGQEVVGGMMGRAEQFANRVLPPGSSPAQTRMAMNMPVSEMGNQGGPPAGLGGQLAAQHGANQQATKRATAGVAATAPQAGATAPGERAFGGAFGTMGGISALANIGAAARERQAPAPQPGDAFSAGMGTIGGISALANIGAAAREPKRDRAAEAAEPMGHMDIAAGSHPLNFPGPSSNQLLQERQVARAQAARRGGGFNMGGMAQGAPAVPPIGGVGPFDKYRAAMESQQQSRLAAAQPNIAAWRKAAAEATDPAQRSQYLTAAGIAGQGHLGSLGEAQAGLDKGQAMGVETKQRGQMAAIDPAGQAGLDAVRAGTMAPEQWREAHEKYQLEQEQLKKLGGPPQPGGAPPGAPVSGNVARQQLERSGLIRPGLLSQAFPQGQGVPLTQGIQQLISEGVPIGQNQALDPLLGAFLREQGGESEWAAAGRGVPSVGAAMRTQPFAGPGGSALGSMFSRGLSGYGWGPEGHREATRHINATRALAELHKRFTQGQR